MSPKPEDKPDHDTNRGQSKTYIITHPTDPSSPREVTQADWRKEKLGQQGWEKPADLDDSEPDAPATPGTTTP